MKRILLTILALVSAKTQVFAADKSKTLVMTVEQLEQIQQVDLNDSSKKNRKVKIDFNQDGQMINLSVFDEDIMSAARADDRSM